MLKHPNNTRPLYVLAQVFETESLEIDLKHGWKTALGLDHSENTTVDVEDSSPIHLALSSAAEHFNHEDVAMFCISKSRRALAAMITISVSRCRKPLHFGCERFGC